MATSIVHLVFLLASLAFFARVSAETSVKEFKALQDDVFGKGYARFFDTFIEEKIHSMIKLIESGDIPSEVQGNQTLDYLKSLTNDCRKAECNLDEDLKRFERLSGRKTKAPNLASYLELCQDRIKWACHSFIYERAMDKLSSVGNQTMLAVKAITDATIDDLRQRMYGQMLYRDNAEAPNHETVLKTLKKLDPAGSKAMLKKWTKIESTLAEFMDQIRLPCITYLDNIDPSVMIFSTGFRHSKAGELYDYLNVCKKVVDNWKVIFEKAYLSYFSYLADPKPKKPSCFSGCFTGSGGGGGGVSTNTLIWMSAGR